MRFAAAPTCFQLVTQAPKRYTSADVPEPCLSTTLVLPEVPLATCTDPAMPAHTQNKQ